MAKFVKGQSGNPSGRPKGVEDVALAARSLTQEALNVLAAGMRGDDMRVASFCAEKLLDRGWGRAANTLEITHHPLDGMTHADLRDALATIRAISAGAAHSQEAGSEQAGGLRTVQ